MGFLDINTEAAVEPTIVEAGEHKLNIIGFHTDDEDQVIRTDKNGLPFMLPIFEIDGEPTAKEFSKFIRLPHDGMTDKERNNCLWIVKSFEKCFSIEEVSNPEEAIGASGYAMLGQGTNDNGDDENFSQGRSLQQGNMDGECSSLPCFEYVGNGS